MVFIELNSAVIQVPQMENMIVQICSFLWVDSSLPRENYKFEQSDSFMRLNNTSRLHQMENILPFGISRIISALIKFGKIFRFSVHRHGTRNIGKKIVQRIDLLVGALQSKFMSEGVPHDNLKWILGMS